MIYQIPLAETNKDKRMSAIASSASPRATPIDIFLIAGLYQAAQGRSRVYLLKNPLTPRDFFSIIALQSGLSGGDWLI